jgi:hypothetical protein
MTTLTTPTVHLNGTGFLNLWTDYENLDDKFHAFTDAWGNMEFNARDYYVQGPDAYTKAREERYAIAQKIKDIKAYIDAHRLALDSQRPKPRP